MSRIWMPGGAGGADLDMVTAGAGDVLAGKVIVGPDGEPLTGTLALTGTAADSQVLAGKTYYNTDAKTQRIGAMPTHGKTEVALNCGDSYAIQAGYHNGQGKVSANSLASQTDANAAAGNILAGKTAWVKGSKVAGTMPDQGKKNVALNCGGSYAIPAGYHNGQGKVSANSLASQTGVQSGKSAAGAGQILTGYEAWVDGKRVTGTMANQGKKEAALNCGGSYTIPAGYHNGQGKVSANSFVSQIKIKEFSGITSSASKKSFQLDSGIGQNLYYIELKNIGFTPIMAAFNNGSYAAYASKDYCYSCKNNTNKFEHASFTSSLIQLPLSGATDPTASMGGFRGVVIGY